MAYEYPKKSASNSEIRMKRTKLRKFNNFLSVIVILVALYIFLAPFMPRIELFLRQLQSNDGDGYVYQNNFNSATDSFSLQPIPQDDRLVIPSILVDEPINQGATIDVLDQGGTWLRPDTGLPNGPGNSVIIAHRYTYGLAAPFYNLDKVKVGDPIIAYWKGQEVDYKVISVKTVLPSDATVEAPTPNRQLTLYTCTPLWTATHRLVIVAEPVTPEQ